jgi:geranyl-CoA carboxylase alpha subunit
VREVILVNREALEGPLDSTLVDVIHHHESGPAHTLAFFFEGRPYHASVVRRGDQYHVVVDGQGFVVSFGRPQVQPAGRETDEGVLRAPMDCRVIAIHKAPGDPVERGEPVVRIESMKLESNLSARATGVVSALHVRVGESLRGGAVVAVIEGGNG